MVARTSGGTRGSAPNADIGSVGARARIAKTTKLMTATVGMAMRRRLRMYLPTYSNLIPAATVTRWICPTASPLRPLRLGYLYQSWMLYISESHPVGVFPLTVVLMPDVTWVRVTIGMITTLRIRLSLACLMIVARLAGSVSLRSWSIRPSNVLSEYRL